GLPPLAFPSLIFTHGAPRLFPEPLRPQLRVVAADQYAGGGAGLCAILTTNVPNG
nr:hypothetical protein [Tanacetum cinerariifolium]